MISRRYTTLWLLLAVALLPLLAAMLIYFSRLGLPEGRTNHGELVVDQRPLQSWQLRRSDGEFWRGEGKWQLLQVADECSQACTAWRKHLPQLHQALGRERDRVRPQRVRLSGAGREDELQFGATTEVAAGIWLADPLGNLVLYYRFEQSPRDLLKDLKRLLKVSKVG